jgi:hypothetical protein
MTSPREHCIWLASFDIGKKNFAFCVEEVDLSKMEQIQNIPIQARYFKDGTYTNEFRALMKKVCLNGNIILLENIDLTEGANTKEYLDPIIFITMTKVLDQYKEYWNQCTSFVIEQQMSFGNKRNTMALKLGQHCLSYFIFQYANFKQSVEFPAYHKTKVLGSPKKMSKYERKMWSVNRALDILIDREDEQTLKNIRTRKKKDDVADTITMLQAFKYLTFVDRSI